MMTPWWVEFFRWHVATDHPWDVALHREAMSMHVAGIGREIGEALLPAITRAADAVRAFMGAWRA